METRGYSAKKGCVTLLKVRCSCNLPKGRHWAGVKRTGQQLLCSTATRNMKFKQRLITVLSADALQMYVSNLSNAVDVIRLAYSGYYAGVV